jgi:hypothetical protein
LQLPKQSHHLDVPPITDAFHKFTGAPLVHKEKRQGSSRFRSAKAESLEKLPMLKGKRYKCDVVWFGVDYGG